MPRTGSLSTVDQQRLTPFGKLLYEHLLSFRPTKTVPEFAREVGVSAQAVWDWLRAGVVPRRQTLVLISERTPELLLDELLQAAGLPTTAQVQRERAAHSDVLRASLEELLRLVDADQTFGPEERALIHRAMEGKVAEFIGQTDTWREYSHASPAQHEAQRATDDALVYEPEPIATPDQAHGSEPSPPRRRSRTDTSSGGFRRVTGS